MYQEQAVDILHAIWNQTKLILSPNGKMILISLSSNRFEIIEDVFDWKVERCLEISKENSKPCYMYVCSAQ